MLLNPLKCKSQNVNKLSSGDLLRNKEILTNKFKYINIHLLTFKGKSGMVNGLFHSAPSLEIKCAFLIKIVSMLL